MDKGIAITQRSTYVIFDVEFTEGGEAGIPDDKANSSITKCLVTAPLSFSIVESLPQGMPIRSEKLCQILLDYYILHDGSSGGGCVRASEIAAGKRRRSCVLEGGDEGEDNNDELGSEEEKEGEEKEDEARLSGGQG